MKILYLIRHAKSSWKDESLEDFERPLNKRGKANAPFMGEFLHKKGITPDIVLSSPAVRAKVTAKIITKKVGYTKEIVYDKDIYEANFSTLDEIIKNIDNKYERAFLFGHNPGFNELCKFYVRHNENIPTSGVVAIEFMSRNWTEIGPENARLVMFEYPKKHI